MKHSPISDRELAFAKEKIARDGDCGPHYSYNFVMKLMARIDASEAKLAEAGLPVSYEYVHRTTGDSTAA